MCNFRQIPTQKENILLYDHTNKTMDPWGIQIVIKFFRETQPIGDMLMYNEIYYTN